MGAIEIPFISSSIYNSHKVWLGFNMHTCVLCLCLKNTLQQWAVLSVHPCVFDRCQWVPTSTHSSTTCGYRTHPLESCPKHRTNAPIWELSETYKHTHLRTIQNIVQTHPSESCPKHRTNTPTCELSETSYKHTHRRAMSQTWCDHTHWKAVLNIV